MKRSVTLVLVVLLAPLARAEEPKAFPAARHGAGELKYIGRVPVLVLKGKPAEMGAQFGKLAVENAPDLGGLHRRFLEDAGQTRFYPFLEGMAKKLKPKTPTALGLAPSFTR